MKTILIEGSDINCPHSYSLVNANQIRYLREMTNTIYFKEIRLPSTEWESIHFDIDSIDWTFPLQPLPADVVPDVVYRISFPYRTKRPQHDKTHVFLFVTAEFGKMENSMFESVKGIEEMVQGCQEGWMTVITPSRWSAQFASRLGIQRNVIILPHGTFVRKEQTFKLKNEHVFLSVGACTRNKGLDVLIAAFLHLHDRVSLQGIQPIYLYIKGLDDLYSSKRMFLDTLEDVLNRIIPPNSKITNSSKHKLILDVVRHNIIYLGKTMTTAEMEELYQKCDCYVAPYSAEGFCMPVLEAFSSSSAPTIIIPKYGPSDEILPDDFNVFRIASEVVDEKIENSMKNLTNLMQLSITTSPTPEIWSKRKMWLLEKRLTWKAVAEDLYTVLNK